jgi:hypothetical protein
MLRLHRAGQEMLRACEPEVCFGSEADVLLRKSCVAPPA